MHNDGLSTIHIGPSSVSRQMNPLSHVNWKHFCARTHVTSFPPLLARWQYIPGPQVISPQSIGEGGRTHLDLIYCLHVSFPGHEEGTISSIHWRFPLHTLSLHLSTSHRSVTLRPFSRKKLGAHRPWQGFSRHSALRNRGHCAPSQLFGQSATRSGQSSSIITSAAPSTRSRSTLNTTVCRKSMLFG